MSPELLDTEIAETKKRTDRPFGVNLITMHPQLSELIDICAKHRGRPCRPRRRPAAGRGDRADQVQWRQARLLCPGARASQEADALGRRRAGDRRDGGRRPHRPGLDLRAGAGNPACRRKDIPVFVAGGIGRGEAIAAYLEMGAVGVQLGTRFVCANECIAHPNFKKAFLRASARDAIPSVQIDPRLPVIPVRALKNREMENFAAKQREVAQRLDEGEIEMAEAQLQIEHYWAGALRRAVIDGDIETGSVMAGQSVGMVNREEPVAEIIQELVDEAAAALESRG